MLNKLMIIILLIFANSLLAFGYDNDGRDAQGNALMKGGAHRTINELALEKYLKQAQQRFIPLDYYTLRGPTVVEPGLEIVTTENRAENFRWWVIEGGYNADEPELYNSFRHFYDPISLDGVPYLTDQLEKLDYVYRAWVWSTGAGAITGKLFGNKFNPQVNARDWAISGEKQLGWGNNEYCWNKGITYMQQAFAETDNARKEFLFAQAWRSLGETMHLLGDMTCVPHVRNDSHPGKAIGYGYIGNTDPNQGMLKNDPYELFTDEKLVRESAPTPLDPAAALAVDSAPDILTLFKQTALYTQEHFFSADTIGGSYLKDKGKPTQRTIAVKSANGKKTYPKPILAKCTFNEQTGYFTSIINGSPVRLCHESWLSSIGWGDPAQNGPQISKACVIDQAKVLIPLAIHANAKLAEWFIPRLEVAITNIDADDLTLSGTITHQPYGAYKTAMLYTQGEGQAVYLWVNGKSLPKDNFQLTIKNGRITGNLNGIQLKNDDKISIGVMVGGLLIRSAAYPMDIGEVPPNCWVFDRIKIEKEIPTGGLLKGNTRNIDVDIFNGGATINFSETSNAINGYTFKYSASNRWTIPPKILVPEEEMTLRLEVQLGDWEATGNTELCDHWSASTQVHWAQTPIKAGAGNSIGLGGSSVGSYQSISHPDRNVLHEERDVIFKISPCYNPGYELAIWFSCGYGYAMYYYRWTGTFANEDGDVG